MLITRSSTTNIESIKQSLKIEFEMTNLGILSYFLGLEFIYTEKGVILHQKKYISKVLKMFNILKCNYVETPVEVNMKLVTSEDEAFVN